MKNDLTHHRRPYGLSGLKRADVDKNPIQQFHAWLEDLRESGTADEINVMTLSTSGADGFPRGRVVLLKNYGEDGFVFYTSYHSEKGKAIVANPKVCLSFFWPALERQVIIKGMAEKVPEEMSENYFHSRPAGSRFGAAVSDQSAVIPNREYIEKKLLRLEEKHTDGKIPRPAHWGGYLVRPQEIEFWQGRANRLHDRIRYTLEGPDWKIERLAP